MSDTAATSNGRSAVDAVLGVAVEGQTYRNLAYLLLAFPLGLTYVGALGFGFVFGLLLAVVGIGIVIWFAVLVGARGVASLERQLANALLAVEVAEPNDRSGASEGGTLATIRSYVEAASTWRALGFVQMKFFFGMVGLLVLLFGVNAIQLVTAPLRYPYSVEFGTVNGQPVAWTVGTLPEALLAVPLGAALGLLLLHVANGFAYVAGQAAVGLLDGSDAAADGTGGTEPGQAEE